MKTAFIGHKKIFAKDIETRLVKAILTEIDNGCSTFTMGTHGEFDSIALNTCRRLRNDYKSWKLRLLSQV